MNNKEFENRKKNNDINNKRVIKELLDVFIYDHEKLNQELKYT